MLNKPNIINNLWPYSCRTNDEERRQNQVDKTMNRNVCIVIINGYEE